MSRMIPFGVRRRCTPSIQLPDRSASAPRFRLVVSHGLEAALLAGRGGLPVDALAADDGAHRGVTREPFGVVGVFVAGEAAVDCLVEQAEQPMPNVIPRRPSARVETAVAVRPKASSSSR